MTQPLFIQFWRRLDMKAAQRGQPEITMGEAWRAWLAPPAEPIRASIWL